MSLKKILPFILLILSLGYLYIAIDGIAHPFYASKSGSSGENCLYFYIIHLSQIDVLFLASVLYQVNKNMKRGNKLFTPAILTLIVCLVADVTYLGYGIFYSRSSFLSIHLLLIKLGIEVAVILFILVKVFIFEYRYNKMQTQDSDTLINT